jgi:hypothetical protein
MPKSYQDTSYKDNSHTNLAVAGPDHKDGKDGHYSVDYGHDDLIAVKDGKDGSHTDLAGYDHSDGSHVYAALLTPSNNSGASGLAVVTLDDHTGTLTVAIEAKGLTPDVIHPQHIHGFPDDKPSHPPTIALDTDRDGFVETPEGAKAVGPVLLSLTASGDVTKADNIKDFPVADAHGRLDFEQTYHFDLSNKQDAQIFHELEDRVAGRALELHGLQVPPGEGKGTPYEVHGQGGYIAELPVAGGILHPVSDPALTSLQHYVDLMA